MLRKVLVAAAAAALLAAGCRPSDPVGWPKPTRFQEAESLYLAKKYPEAKARFLALATSEAPPEKMFAKEALYYAARCDQSQGNWSEAVKVYNRLLETPTYRRLEVRALASRGDISLELGDYAGAVHDYARARRLLGDIGQIEDIDAGKLLFGLGKAYRSLAITAGDLSEREARYRQADQCFDEYMNRYPNGRFFDEARRLNSRTTGRAPVTDFYVLVGGSTTVKDQAGLLARRLEAKGYAPRVVSETRSGVTVYSVRVGSFENNREAYALARKLQAEGFSTEVAPP